MRRALTGLLVAVVLGLGLHVAAQEDATGGVDAAVVQEFLQISKAREKYEVGLLAGFDASFGMQDLSMVPPDHLPKIQAMQKKIKDLMLTEMGWTKIEPEFVRIYAESFTTEELKAITQLLDTPTGRMMIEKELLLMPKSMEISQKLAMQVMPKIQQLVMQEMQGGL